MRQRPGVLGTNELLVLLRSGEATVTRRARHRDGVLVLDLPVEATWRVVHAALYGPHEPENAWDWHDYHPARIVDPDLPHRIELLPHDGRTLSLAARDRVALRYLGTSRRTTVLAVTGSTGELEEAVEVRGSEVSIRVAKIAEQDPLGNADSAAMAELGMSWMKYMFDPWGQLHLGTAVSQTWADLLLRSGRYLFGSQSWSVLPLFGYVFTTGSCSTATTSATGLGSSRRPRRSPVTSTARSDGLPARSPTATGSRSATWSSVTSPGTGTGRSTRRRRSCGPGARAHRGSTPSGTTCACCRSPRAVPPPGPRTGARRAIRPARPRAVPAVLAQPDPAAPHTAEIVAAPRGLVPSDRAPVPTSPTSERVLATYVAFSRPGSHRVTTGPVGGAERAQGLHDRGDRPLRARITAGVSPTPHEETTVVVTEARDVVIVVQRWLDGFLTEAPGADPQG
jgi:large repetitive protein